MIQHFSKLLVTFVALSVLLAGCADHDHDHDHGHDHEEEVPKGPNGGRLFTEGGYGIEVLIDERPTPRFVVWLYAEDAAVKNDRASVTLVTERLGGLRTTFDLQPTANGWRSQQVVNEPHSFDVEVSAKIDDKTIVVQFPSYEGRTVIDAQAAAAAGIVSAVATSGSLTESLEASGTLHPEVGAEAKVVARFAGVLRSLEVQLGDRVKRGQLLAKVDSNLSLDTYSLTAPISGVVSAIDVKLGSSVDGDAVMTIVDPQKLRADILLYGTDAKRVAIGAAVTLENLADRSSANGKVTRVSPAVDPSTQGVVAQVALAEKRDTWRAGTAVRARVSIGESLAKVRVPRSAIQNFAGKTVVFIREGDVFEARPVTLGRQDGEFVEVLDGLLVGQQVVVTQSFLIKADIEKSAAVHDH